MGKSKTDYKALARNIARVANIKKIFPISHTDFRSEPTDYQKRKLRKVAKELLLESDPAFWSRDFIPLKEKQRKVAQTELQQPAYLRGIFLPGGAEANRLEFDEGRFTFYRGVYGYVPDYFSTVPHNENDLEKQLKTKFENKPKTAYTVALQAGKWRMKEQVYADERELFIRKARKIWLKYALDYLAGKNRIDAKGKNHGAQAHPSEWLKGVIWETKPKGTKRAKK